MCRKDNFLCSIQKKDFCKTCKITFDVQHNKYIPVKMNQFDITNIQPLIVKHSANKSDFECLDCDSQRDIEIQPSQFMVIETDVKSTERTAPTEFSRALINDITSDIMFYDRK